MPMLGMVLYNGSNSYLQFIRDLELYSYFPLLLAQVAHLDDLLLPEPETNRYFLQLI